MKKIVGFAGRQRSGKTLICKHLRDTKGATIVTVANALKQLCCELLSVDTIEKLNELKDDPNNVVYMSEYDKEAWVNILYAALGLDKSIVSTQHYIVNNSIEELFSKNNTSVRELLQFIGTNIIREVNKNWHTSKLIEAINNAPSDLVVVDDVRFPNEKKVIEDLGGDVFFIIRTNNFTVSNHPCETSLHWYDFSDNRVIVNFLGIDTLLSNFTEYFERDFRFANDCMILKSGAHSFDDVNPRFGILSETNDAEVADFINSIIGSQSFKNCSIIFAMVNGGVSVVKFNRLLYNTYKNCSEQYVVYTIFNPYIIENLKEWML